MLRQLARSIGVRSRNLGRRVLFRPFSSAQGSENAGKPEFQFPVWKSMAFFVATGAGLLIYYQNERNKQLLKKIGEGSGQVGTPSIGGPFQLVDCEGREFTDRDLLGKYYLLYFGFTHCPDICPEELSKIAEVVQTVKNEMPDAPLVSVFITCDPERDTPEIIKNYLKDFGNDFVGLSGPSDVIKSVAKSFRVYYRPTQTSSSGDYLIDHSIFFYLMGPEGKFITNFGRNVSVKECAELVRNEIKSKMQ